MDTRLRKLEAGEYDAVILAAAGLNRLGKTGMHTASAGSDCDVPSRRQGALAIEIRKDDSEIRDQCRLFG